jgi:hypothetical protein
MRESAALREATAVQALRQAYAKSVSWFYSFQKSKFHSIAAITISL